LLLHIPLELVRDPEPFQIGTGGNHLDIGKAVCGL
jgi:hypothetical protein